VQVVRGFAVGLQSEEGFFITASCGANDMCKIEDSWHASKSIILMNPSFTWVVIECLLSISSFLPLTCDCDKETKS